MGTTCESDRGRDGPSDAWRASATADQANWSMHVCVERTFARDRFRRMLRATDVIDSRRRGGRPGVDVKLDVQISEAWRQKLDVQISEAWRQRYPGASIGVLAMDGVENPPDHPALAERVEQIEAELRARWSGATRADLLKLPTLDAYRRYYRTFGKTYHVQLQLESVVLKGRQLRADGALVLAMFAAELRNLLLTAGHDLASVEGPLRVGAAEGSERYTGRGGRELSLQPGDMFIADAEGILTSVLYGPDDRTPIRPETRAAVFCVYAPPGIEADMVARHLDDVAGLVRLVAPSATVLQQRVYPARG
jgi:DNA/RNA-binding domain of Phe-tRNA-synthetase-like protein